LCRYGSAGDLDLWNACRLGGREVWRYGELEVWRRDLEV
jgi:hypothetical protein